MKALFIYNPHAGKVLLKNHFWDIINILSVYDLEVKATKKDEDLINYVQEKAVNYDLIICSGGDGTLNQVASGIARCPIRKPLGYIPSGSTNDFSNSLKLPKNMVKAAKLIVDGKALPVDIGKFNNQNFIYVSAFGLFSEVSYATDQKVKNRFGHAAYIVEGIKSLSEVETYHIKIETENETLEGDYIYGMVSNTISVGGVYDLSKKEVKLDDGLFEVMLIKKPHDLLEFLSLVPYFLGIENKNSLVYEFKTNKIKITPDKEMKWTLDGEYGGKPDTVNIEVIHNAYDIIHQK